MTESIEPRDEVVITGFAPISREPSRSEVTCGSDGNNSLSNSTQTASDRPVGAVVPSRDDSKDWLAPPAAEPHAPPPPTPYIFELFLFNESCTISDGHSRFSILPPNGYRLKEWKLDAHSNVVICWEPVA